MNTLGYRNHKSCKIQPKFLPTLLFLQESYKFVQEPQILQICYNVEHFLQDSDNIFAKIAFFRNKFLQKIQSDISTKNSKIIKLPATTATFTVYNAQTAPGSQKNGQNS